MAGPSQTGDKGRVLRISARKLTSSLEAGQWETAAVHARNLGELAEDLRDWYGLLLAGTHLGRLREAGLSARFLAISGRLRIDGSVPEWDGNPQHNKTLLVHQRIGDIGAPIRLARLIAPAARQFKRSVVLVEPRLVPLFRRSFPDVEMRPREPIATGAMSGADFLASYETLMRYLAPTEDAILRGFSPLKADPPQIERLRNTYCSSNESRLVGISWTSTNQKKDLPPLTEWARLLGRTGAKFVSIQYSPNKEDLEALGASSGKPVLYDETVDSLANLDLSAAQIAAMDAVVTISNTAAHMAGALGVRTFVIVDDKQHLFWPVSGETTPWYPHTTIIRREGRDWGAVIDQVAKLLSAYLAGAGRN